MQATIISEQFILIPNNRSLLLKRPGQPKSLVEFWCSILENSYCDPFFCSKWDIRGQVILESRIYCSKYLVLPSYIEDNVFIIISFLFSVPVLFLCTIGLGVNGGHVGNGPISGPKREDFAEVPLIGLSHKISLE